MISRWSKGRVRSAPTMPGRSAGSNRGARAGRMSPWARCTRLSAPTMSRVLAGAAAIDEVDHRQAALEGDILSADVFADGFLEERAALGRGVVGDDHADHASDRADAGH